VSVPAKKNNGLPAYQRIQCGIRKRIESGHLRPGDAVDSERDLAKDSSSQLDDRPHALPPSNGKDWSSAVAASERLLPLRKSLQ